MINQSCQMNQTWQKELLQPCNCPGCLMLPLISQRCAFLLKDAREIQKENGAYWGGMVAKQSKAK